MESQAVNELIMSRDKAEMTIVQADRLHLRPGEWERKRVEGASLITIRIGNHSVSSLTDDEDAAKRMLSDLLGLRKEHFVSLPFLLRFLLLLLLRTA